MYQACWELTRGNYMGLQHERLKSDRKQTSRQSGNNKPSPRLCLSKISPRGEERPDCAGRSAEDGQAGAPQDASAGPEKDVTMVQQPFLGLSGDWSGPTVSLKGSHWACSGAGAVSSRTCPGQRQATTLLFKGFIKE